MKKILIIITKYLSRATIARYKPIIIGITGNTGKTSTKDAISAVLSTRFHVRKSEENFNNELGLPLTILGISASGKNIVMWLVSFVQVLFRLLYTRYPEILVLEMGVDKPGDMKYLLQIVTPDIAVFTTMGDIPVHVENFVNRDALIREKLKLASAVSVKGHVVYNADVQWWEPIRSKTKGIILTYGFSDTADIQLSVPEIRFKTNDTYSIPLGISCKVQYKGSTVPFRLDGVLAQSGVYFAGAASAVGSIMGMNLVETASAFSSFIPPHGRLEPKLGISDSVVIDDTYNASPSSMKLAIDTLASLPAKRKIAVIGDMLELGSYSEEAHRDIGKQIFNICTVVYTVGIKTKFTDDELIKQGFQKGTNLFSLEGSIDAAKAIYADIQPGDMILVKGSHGMHMEKVVEQIVI